MEIKLSILIATMPSRYESLNKLLAALYFQINTGLYSNVQIITDYSMEYNIGIKRNKLLKLAKGDYVVFIDDDDEVSDMYIFLILEALKSNPDCVGISGIITTDGHDQRQWHISKEYDGWFTGADGNYCRTPNHISPVRRELALQAGFPEIAFGEDHVYSMRLLPLLKTEVVVLGNLYYYKFISNK